jgi:hypothetical protein
MCGLMRDGREPITCATSAESFQCSKPTDASCPAALYGSEFSEENPLEREQRPWIVT